MKDFFASLRKETLIFTGVITPYIKKLPQTVISLLAREEVVAANAALTAEGILAMVIQNTPRSLPEYCYDVIGFGHCGRAIAGLFHQLGLEVRIVSAHAHPESAQLPYSFIRLQEWQFQQPWPVVINTAPAEVISEAMLADTAADHRYRFAGGRRQRTRIQTQGHACHRGSAAAGDCSLAERRRNLG